MNENKLYVVGVINFVPPEIDSVWSTPKLALIRMKKLTRSQHGIFKVFVEEIDSGEFTMSNSAKKGQDRKK